MTIETNGNDPRVSDAYREMAGETTSPELDRKILAMATAEARAAHGVPRTWFRPLAWAATIALSFALVLEIMQVDDAGIPRTDADLLEALEESPRPAEAAEKQKNEARVKQQLNKRSSDVPAAGKAAIAPTEPEAAARDAAVNTPTPERASVASDFEQDNLGLVREAEEQDRMRSEPARAFSALVETKELTDRCSQEDRSSAETWFECVKAMQDAGRAEAAEQEFEALRAEFPDFRAPSEDR